MISLDNGDKIRGDAAAATVVDYTVHGIVGTTITQLADGQLAATITDIYTASAAVGVASIVLVNTDSSARAVNLYLTPSGGTARRLIPKNLSLGVGYSLVFDGQKTQVMDTSGQILQSFSLSSAGVTATAAELNLLDLSGLTAGQLLVATAATTAAWQSTGVTLTAPAINGTVTTTGLTLPAFTLGGTLNANSQLLSAFSSLEGVATGFELRTASGGSGAVGINTRATNTTTSVRRVTFGAGDTATVAWADSTHTNFNLSDYIGLFKTDTDSSVEAELWYDDSENVLKYYNGTTVKTIATV